MAFNVNLYTFSKKSNSTARPTGTGTTYQCVSNTDLDVLSPRIPLNIAANPTAYNYAYIPDFGRYYYINNWQWEAGLWVASMTVDSLASWRTEISGQSVYVARAASAYNGAIVDTLYPTSTTITRTQVTGTSPWSAISASNIITSGTVVVGVVGAAAPNYYAMSWSSFVTFISWIFSDNFAALVSNGWTILSDQVKVLLNPADYITSVMWFPWQETGGSTTQITVGYWHVPASARLIAGGQSVGASVFQLTNMRHPQAGRGQYLNSAPYSRYSVVYPPWGKMELDANIVAQSSDITCLYNVDMRTGAGTLRVVSDSSETLAVLQSQVGVPWPVSRVRVQGTGANHLLSAGMSLAANLAMENYPGAIMSAANSISDAAARAVPMVSTMGAPGSISSLAGVPTLQGEFYAVASDDVTLKGRPLCETRTVGTLSGYIKCADADISIACTAEELASIRAMMLEGFFYE